MNKKLLIILVLLLTLTFVGCKREKEEQKKDEPKVEEKAIFELDEYKGLILDDIIELETVKYTEGGDNHETTIDKDEITRIFNMLKGTKIGDLTERACDDSLHGSSPAAFAGLYIYTFCRDCQIQLF